MPIWSALPLFLVLAAAPAGKPTPHEILDLDFEAPRCVGGWSANGQSYSEVPDPAVAHTGRQSLRLRYEGKEAWKDEAWAFAESSRAFPVAAAAGKTLRFSGYIRTDAVEHGSAGLWGRVDGKAGTLALDNMEGRGAHGTSPWKRYEIELAVPREAQAIYLGALLAGDGTAWFDSLSITLDGKPYREGRRPPAAPPTRAARQWLARHALPFATAEPGHGLDDLAPLLPWIGQARVVGLGEATHGTREFFEMKHRLIELLFSRLGFTIFGIEASMPDTEPLNRYVLTGEGDPAELVKGMGFWTWRTREVLDLALFLRAFNQSGRGPVQFRGFDMQNPKSAAAVVRGFVAKAEPGFSPRLAEAYTWIGSEEPRRPTPETMQARVAAAREVLAHLEAGHGGTGEKAAAEEAEWAIENARIVTQYLAMVTGEGTRDQAMADNVGWLLSQAPKDARIVLWAHNGHVRKSGPFLGSFLAQRYGAAYLAFGLAFDHGRYRAVGPAGLGEHEAPPAFAGSLESYLASAGLPRFFLDLRNLSPQAPSAPWLTRPHPFRDIGALATSCGYEPLTATESYDALVFFADTHPSVPLP